jgi:hypothetical protein
MRKHIFKTFLVVLALSSFFSCKREKNLSSGIWNSGPLTGYEVTPINGGARITYDVPRNNDLLYVMAEYERNGKVFTDKASVYTNALKIEGFGTEDPVTVKLYKVNRKGQRSEPVTVEFKPLKSLVAIAHDSLKLLTTFGGITASWSNPFATSLGVRLMTLDSTTGHFKTDTMYFSESKHDEHTFRGYAAKETTFGISFEDKWGNVSDTTYLKTTPFFETKIAKPYKDVRAEIPYDNTTDLSSHYSFSHLWDNIVNTSHSGWLSATGSSGLSITIDMGQYVKLSRIVFHNYHLNDPYSNVNITRCEMWGTDTIYIDKLKDKDYWLDEYSVRNDAIHGVSNTYQLPAKTFENVWQYLGFYSIPRYDQEVPPDNQAILNLAANGWQMIMPLDDKPVRYVRIYAREVVGTMPPPANNYFSLGEITFYGDNTVPQHAQP